MAKVKVSKGLNLCQKMPLPLIMRTALCVASGSTLLDRVHQRLLLGEVAEDDVCVGLGHRK